MIGFKSETLRTSGNRFAGLSTLAKNGEPSAFFTLPKDEA